jgi:hypothetical protein
VPASAVTVPLIAGRDDEVGICNAGLLCPAK